MSSTRFWFLFSLFLLLFSSHHQLTNADKDEKAIVHHESSSILVHFTLDHFRGPLWKMSNLVYISNGDDGSNHQPHYRHWPIRNGIDDNDYINNNNNDATIHSDKNRLHFILSCDINSDQTNGLYHFIQNCSLYQIETIVVRKLIRPKFNLLLNLFHNSSYQWERPYNYPITPTKLDDRTSLRLVSVLEENKRMILRCVFKKRCIIKHENQSAHYDFDVVYHNDENDSDELNSRFQRQLINDDYDYYEYDDSDTDHHHESNDNYISKYTAYLLVTIISLFTIILLVLKQILINYNYL
ncbi:hypothetical protein HUG17_2358 [Dermatophagoides farinae]|uniref:Uncharacterized protein n=1 Tax=Dermatophagoides farinae TaxID=6954 RepID=A0A9D4PBE3_DERFA|nr:hypothetical protein HUG17_2358 [Dermatophagoides farinae]